MGCKHSLPERSVVEPKLSGGSSKPVHIDSPGALATTAVGSNDVRLEEDSSSSGGGGGATNGKNSADFGGFRQSLSPVEEGGGGASASTVPVPLPAPANELHFGGGDNSTSSSEEYESTDDGLAAESSSSASESSSLSTVPHRAVSSRFFIPEKLMIGLEDFQLSDILSFGSSGKIFKGQMLASGAPIAAKRFFAPTIRRDPSERNIFMSEINMIRDLNHPNILKYIGVAFSYPFYWVVSELAVGNSLEWRIRMTLSRISTQELGGVVTDIARAVEFLHSLDPPVVHRDLKPGNVLLKGNGVAVLADFGYAVRMTKASKLVTRLGSPAYVAPEILVGQVYDEKIDIYAFGVMMWELVFRKEPYMDMMQGSLENLMQYVCMGGRLDTPGPNDPVVATSPLIRDQLYEQYTEILESCWGHSPRSRPDAKRLLADVTGLFRGVLAQKQSPAQQVKIKAIPDHQLDMHRALFLKDTFEAGLALVAGTSLNEATPDGWNALHEVIATENHEMLKFVLKWNGSAPVDVNARTGRGVDIFELARSVGPGIAMNMFGIFRNVKSKTFVSVPTFRKKMFILGALETFVRRTYLYNALRTWRDNT